jgi:alpha-mannosidase
MVVNPTRGVIQVTDIVQNSDQRSEKVNNKTLYMIGNAHIDPVWLWRWQEGFHEVRATFRSALDRMKEFPDFVFISSSAQFYEWIERSDPAMFEEIRQRIEEGRWEIVGGWWIQPDCNIPSGESLVRHALYGQRYFQSRFGRRAKVGYNVDSFGHAGSFPQILLKSGLENYVFMRPSPHEKGLPTRVFWWESADGSRVLTYRIPFEYCINSVDALIKHIPRVANEIREPLDALMCFYGVGNHGGGPTKAQIAEIIRQNTERMDGENDTPTMIFSTPDRYFDMIRERISNADLNLPTVNDDLQMHAPGCYAAHSGIKAWNRRAENLLGAAEKFSALAYIVNGQPYPTDFEDAWKRVLFNQFHDILAGTSLESAYEDARREYGYAMTIADHALNYAVQSFAWRVNIPLPENAQDVRPVQVFNPHAWASRQNIELEFGRFSEDGDMMIDEDGNEIHVEATQSEATSGGRNRITFTVDLPPMGYRTLFVKPRLEPLAIPYESSQHVLENPHMRVEFDPDSGYIRSLRHYKANVELVYNNPKTGELRPMAVPVVIDDPSDTWSHNVFKFDKVVGAFVAKSVQRIDYGTVRSTIRVISTYGDSTLVQDFTLCHDLDYIDVMAMVDWREQWKMLKLRFPVNVHLMKVTSEIPYGHIERDANADESPGGAWLDISGSSRENNTLCGLSIINDSKYSYDVNVRDMGMTILRSPIYAHHDPLVPDPISNLYSYQDQGVQKFRYRIYPHAGTWDTAHTVQIAAELNQPAIALNGTFHEGTLPQSGSFLSVDAPNVIVGAMKKAEDGDDLILRVVETSRRATTTRIELLGRAFEATFAPSEIKTFRIPKDGEITEVNLLEE